MKVIIDIVHPADINFYKNAIGLLNKQSIGIEIIIRPRGVLIQILENEYQIPYTIIGEHHTSLYSKILGVFKRDIQLISYLRKKDFDVVTGFGNISVAQSAQILRKSSVIFYDDYEYKLVFYLSKLSATRYVIPKSIPSAGKNTYKYNGFKELAYLHPNYFKPDRRVLEQYGITPSNYVFIREVSRVSMNYKNLQQMDLPGIVHRLNDFGLEVILSLEDKTRADSLKDKCTILEEPVDDIFSLMRFALFTISSGDSMARESCLVGTPAIYTGGRDMIVNKELIERGCMFKADNKQQLNVAMTNIIESDVKEETKRTIEKAVKYEWMDTTEVILDILTAVANKDESLLAKYKVTEDATG